jgi:hypothetical protein
MSKQTRASHPIYSLLPTEVEGFDSLAELALDMRWSWNHATDNVWRQLDPVLGEFTQNPWVVLQTVSRDQLRRVSADPAFRKKVDALVQIRRQAAKAPACFQQDHRCARAAGARWQSGLVRRAGRGHEPIPLPSPWQSRSKNTEVSDTPYLNSETRSVAP